MKICFLARPSFDVYSTVIFNKLKAHYDKNIEGFFITSNEKESNYIRKNVPEGHIFETSKFLRKNWMQYTVDDLVEMEKKYDCVPIWKYIYTDRFLINRDYDYCINVTVGLFKFFEDIFTKNRIDFYYSECIATLQCYIAYIVGQKYNVQYLTQMCARGGLDSTYHYFTTDPYQLNSDLTVDYLQQKYTEKELECAEKYLSEFETKNITPPAMNLVKTEPKVDKSFILAPLRYLKGRINPDLNDPCSYMYYKAYQNCLNPVKFYLRYQKMKGYFQRPNYNIKYIYYPLHFQPEASTCVCAEKYEKQLFFIDSWAKSLPADTELYVKEHYAFLGSKDVQFYKELQKYPNVIFIDPWESSRKLIDNSVAVTTLTGTAGFEAMLLRKPVFLGGNADYENAPGVIKIKDIYQSYIPLMKAWKKPERQEIIKYLCACFRTYCKGNIYCQSYHHLLSENIDDIVNSLYNKLVKLEE